MSGICGIVGQSEHSTPATQVIAMIDALAHRGPDRRSHVEVGAAAFGQLELWTRFCEANEPLPWQDTTSGLTVVLDGRIDNRAEMRAQLRLQDGAPTSDAAIIARAYQAWGVTAPDRLIGDFAFAIWDAPRRTLYCARDIASAKPFCYAISGNTIAFASEIRGLLALPQIERDIDFGFLGELILTTIRSQVDTVYKQIKRLRPAHWMTWCEGNVRTGCYWDFSRLSLRTAISTGDAVEGIAHHHREAVLHMATTDYPVGAHLSGGVDSSGNCVAIDELLRSGQLRAPAAYAMATLFPGFSCNEPEYIRAVAETLSFETLYFQPQWPSSEEHFAQIALRGEPGPYPHLASFASGYRGLKALGGRVVLGGENGDELFLADPRMAARLVWKGQLQQARKRLERLGQVKPEVSYLAMLRLGVTLGLPQTSPSDTLHRIRASRWQRRMSGAKRLSDAWIKREHLGQRILAPLGVALSGNPYIDASVGHFFKGYMSNQQEMCDVIAATAVVEIRSPFMYKPLVEFCAMLPPSFRDDATNQRKWPLRESMRGRLPVRIVDRGEKVDFGDAYGAYVRSLADAQISQRAAVNASGLLPLTCGDGQYSATLAVEGEVFEPGALVNVIAWSNSLPRVVEK